MNNNVLICSNEKIYCKILSRNFFEYGIIAEISPDNETSIIRKLSERKYGAVLLSGIGNSGKKSGLVRRISKLFPYVSIAVLVYTSLYEECRKFISAGADRCIIMPQAVANICVYVMNLINDMGLYLQETADFMESYGFPHTMNGFYYFCSATETCITCCSDRISEIYGIVAENYSTTPKNVESSIRHFINVSYSRGNVKRFFDGLDLRPSNSRMIYSVSEALSDFYGIFRDGKDKSNKTRILVYSSDNIFMNLNY